MIGIEDFCFTVPATAVKRGLTLNSSLNLKIIGGGAFRPPQMLQQLFVAWPVLPTTCVLGHLVEACEIHPLGHRKPGNDGLTAFDTGEEGEALLVLL